MSNQGEVEELGGETTMDSSNLPHRILNSSNYNTNNLSFISHNNSNFHNRLSDSHSLMDDRFMNRSYSQSPEYVRFSLHHLCTLAKQSLLFYREEVSRLLLQSIVLDRLMTAMPLIC
jgi:poly-D-alanine transfer protein DltD